MEYFDIIDPATGLPTGQTISRTEAHATGTPHRTAHVWILRTVDGRQQVLLQKRSLAKDSFPGCYDTSSAGHIPAGSEPKESALRELSEELGIEASENELLPIGHFEIRYERPFHGHLFKDNEYANVYVLTRPVDISDITPQKEELDSVAWFDFEYLREAIGRHDPRFCVPTPGLAVLEAYLRGRSRNS